jgi:hypothetical protein
MHQSLCIFVFLAYLVLSTIALPAASPYTAPIGHIRYKLLHNETSLFVNQTLKTKVIEDSIKTKVGIRKASPVNIPNVKIPSGLPTQLSEATISGLAPVAAAPGDSGKSGCIPGTTNTQSNQCSSGIPYCCSPNGDGGTVSNPMLFLRSMSLFSLYKYGNLFSYNRTQLPE